MVRNIRFLHTHFGKGDPRKWIFPTIFWCDTKLSQFHYACYPKRSFIKNAEKILVKADALGRRPFLLFFERTIIIKTESFELPASCCSAATYPSHRYFIVIHIPQA